MTARLEKACNILRWAITNNKTLTESCKHFGMTDSNFRDIRKKSKGKEGYKEFDDLYIWFKGDKTPSKEEEDLTEGQKKFTQSGDTASIDYKGNKMLTSLEEAIEFFKIDTTQWIVERYVCNSYPVSARKREQDLTWINGVMSGHAKREDEWTTSVNYQIKVWLKSKVKTDDQKADWEFFLKTIKDYAPAYLRKTIRKVNPRYLFELSIPDLHIGKLAWDKESGEDYDTKIAIERFKEAVESLIEQAAHAQDKIEKILLPIGNDLVNIDSKHNMTTAGTPQNVDSRWQQMFLKTLNLMISTIDRCTLIAPVEVKMIPGNHDEQTIFYLGESLKAWYRTSDCVTIDNSPVMRKYVLYGNTLIGFTHGNEEKHHDLGLIMATEVPELWAKAKFREVHLGHLHKKKEVRWINQDEHQGFKVKVLPSLSATDAWHARKAYMSQKGAMGFLYDKERGCVAEYNFNLMTK